LQCTYTGTIGIGLSKEGLKKEAQPYKTQNIYAYGCSSPTSSIVFHVSSIVFFFEYIVIQGPKDDNPPPALAAYGDDAKEYLFSDHAARRYASMQVARQRNVFLVY
jgi:hypothetical protein